MAHPSITFLLLILSTWSCLATPTNLQGTVQTMEIVPDSKNMTRGTVYWSTKCDTDNMGLWQGYSKLEWCDVENCELRLDHVYNITSSLFQINFGSSYQSLTLYVTLKRSNPDESYTASYDAKASFEFGSPYTISALQELPSSKINNNGEPLWTVTVDVRNPNSKIIVCETYKVKLTNNGPLITISNFLMGLLIMSVTLPRFL